MDLAKAISTQISNILAKTGKSIEELANLVTETGLQKHGEKLAWVKDNLGLGHGDANALVHHITKMGLPEAAPGDPLDEIYSGAKANLRPIHDAVMDKVNQWGAFEIHPKKGYVALRRKKQFAMLGPATNTRVELGLNSKTMAATDRLVAQAPGGMCQFKVQLTDVSQVDDELFHWLKTAFDESGQ